MKCPFAIQRQMIMWGVQRLQSVNSTACAWQSELSQHLLLFLTWKGNINHRKSIHFRKLWWYQLEEINNLRKIWMSYRNCFSFWFSYLAPSTLFSVCLLSHCHSSILRHSSATDTTTDMKYSWNSDISVMELPTHLLQSTKHAELNFLPQCSPHHPNQL